MTFKPYAKPKIASLILPTQKWQDFAGTFYPNPNHFAYNFSPVILNKKLGSPVIAKK